MIALPYLGRKRYEEQTRYRAFKTQHSMACQRKCGGTSDAKQADQEIQDYIEQIKGELESRINRTFLADSFKAVSYKSQVVAGTNFFVKIDVGNGEYVHARIFRALPCNGGNLSLHGVQEGKTFEEEIEYF